ncbi:MBL fold metallo-hydrolase [Dehalobacterium formicoaceticum]|uniref:MBL fold metallo-hydrolase n=1 Tax=Dehalobacterium formicoaceticum TaxID=51515 RepID=A0ABT1Y3N8_9FIRM|nr:MBL fold metallo-hydrolase [Dehalobacterium formicoaceticum]MCR6545494.1 MBL fold metallo-hydrolase [Dehalobacterium formicoaceticum]
MECATLFSGSSGNCIYVGTGNTKVLVDAGSSGKRIMQALDSINIDIKEIQALLVTHEHIDHIKGLGVLSRRYDIPIYASPKTWQELTCIGKIAEYNQKEFDYGLEIGDLKVDFFKTSHDAIQPVGMVFYHREDQVGIATDTGCITSGMKKALAGANAIFFEANHDEEMLVKGPYPFHLKKRISGDKGHLSNHTAGEALKDMITGNTQHVILSHLSEVNNTPEAAYHSVANTLAQADILDKIALTVAPRYQTHSLIKIKRL